MKKYFLLTGFYFTIMITMLLFTLQKADAIIIPINAVMDFTGQIQNPSDPICRDNQISQTYINNSTSSLSFINTLYNNTTIGYRSGEFIGEYKLLTDNAFINSITKDGRWVCYVSNLIRENFSIRTGDYDLNYNYTDILNNQNYIGTFRWSLIFSTTSNPFNTTQIPTLNNLPWYVNNKFYVNIFYNTETNTYTNSISTSTTPNPIGPSPVNNTPLKILLSPKSGSIVPTSRTWPNGFTLFDTLRGLDYVNSNMIYARALISHQYYNDYNIVVPEIYDYNFTSTDYFKYEYFCGTARGKKSCENNFKINVYLCYYLDQARTKKVVCGTFVYTVSDNTDAIIPPLDELDWGENSTSTEYTTSYFSWDYVNERLSKKLPFSVFYQLKEVFQEPNKNFNIEGIDLKAKWDFKIGSGTSTLMLDFTTSTQRFISPQIINIFRNFLIMVLYVSYIWLIYSLAIKLKNKFK